jgi:hypothetical protein
LLNLVCIKVNKWDWDYTFSFSTYLQWECTSFSSKNSSSNKRFWIKWAQNKLVVMIKTLIQANRIVECWVSFWYWAWSFRMTTWIT